MRGLFAMGNMLIILMDSIKVGLALFSKKVGMDGMRRGRSVRKSR